MKKMIQMLKVGRLMTSILMIASIIAHTMLTSYYTLPSLDLIVTLWVSLFVFLLGLQYHIEKKPGYLALFLMFFSVIMAIMTLVGIAL